jgi:hypothetical protein
MQQHLCVYRILCRKQRENGEVEEESDAPLLTSSSDVASLFG